MLQAHIITGRHLRLLPQQRRLRLITRMDQLDSTGRPPRLTRQDRQEQQVLMLMQLLIRQPRLKLKRTISLTELKSHPELENLALVRRGNRLSVMPVSEDDWTFILSLE